VILCTRSRVRVRVLGCGSDVAGGCGGIDGSRMRRGRISSQEIVAEWDMVLPKPKPREWASSK
jgi:hypothetical protein